MARAGLPVATLGEAESFCRACLAEIFVAYPLWADAARAPRRAPWAERNRLPGVVRWPRCASWPRPSAGTPAARPGRGGLRRRRSGAARPTRAGSRPGRPGGPGGGRRVTFPGHSYGPGMPARAAADEAAALAAAADSLAAAGAALPGAQRRVHPSAARCRAGPAAARSPSCGPAWTRSTTRSRSSWAAARWTTWRCPCWPRGQHAGTGPVRAGRGAKVLGYDRPAWVPGHGLLPAFPAATVTGLWEHHAAAVTGDGPRRRWATGSS